MNNGTTFARTRKRQHSPKEDTNRERLVLYTKEPSRYWVEKNHEEEYLSKKNNKKVSDEKSKLKLKMLKKVDDRHVISRTGGAYIPPTKLRMMQAQITDKSSLEFQRLSWEALKKSIHGLINKVNISNLPLIITSLFKENIIRGRGLLIRSIIEAQAASPTLTYVYATLVALINTKLPKIGELLLTRLTIQFRRGFRRKDKQICLSSTRFIAHLVNQQVAHELLALEVLTLLLENATNDSVEVAVGFLKECGQKLGEVSPRGLTATLDHLRHVLHEADLDKRVKYMIEVMFQVRKDKFKDNPAVISDLDLVEEQDQITHLISFQDEELDSQDMLNVFKHDSEYEANEKKYQAIKKEIICDENDGTGDSEEEENDESEDGSASEKKAKEEAETVDKTERNLIGLRRTIYLTIQSSLDHNDCAHKIMKLQLKPEQEAEFCQMILNCCAQQKTYEKFFGLLAQRFCQINKMYIASFEQVIRDTYDIIHRLDTNKLRNVAKLFAHLLFINAISWKVLAHIRLNEEDTTNSSRVFLKILFQELADYMGLKKLNQRLKDPTLQTYFEGLFPLDERRNTRFAVNFFTLIGLGGLTNDLRKHLESHPKAAQTEQSLHKLKEVRI